MTTAPQWEPTDDATPFAAEAERDRAYAMLDAADYADETQDILRTIVRLGIRLGEFSANDLRPLLPADVHPPRIGRAFGLAQDLGLIRYVGMVKSNDRSTHGKGIGLYSWVGAGSPDSHEWLGSER